MVAISLDRQTATAGTVCWRLAGTTKKARRSAHLGDQHGRDGRAIEVAKTIQVALQSEEASDQT